MLEHPEITTAAARPSAVIHVTVPRSDISKVMAPAIGELMAAVQRQGAAPAGPLYAYHLRLDETVFDFELGVPVAGQVRPEGRMTPGTLPGGMVARCTYVGPYDGLHRAWEEFDRWMVGQGFIPGEHLWECYLKGPESSPDPSTWRTELTRPVTRR